MREAHERIRREAIRAIVEAARTDGVDLRADAVAIVSEPDLVIANAPVAGLEALDFKSMLDGKLVLDKTAVMYWYLAGDALSEPKLDEGFYTVVADQRRGVVELRNNAGQAVAEGDLEICIEPPAQPPTAVAKMGVSGSVTKFKVDLKKHHIEVCGNASASIAGATVTIEGCITVDW